MYRKVQILILLLISFLAVDLEGSGGKLLGKEEVGISYIVSNSTGGVNLSASLSGKLGSKADEFSGLVAKYADDFGDDAAKILDDVDDLIADKSVINLIEDSGQGTILVRITRADKSDAAIAIHKTASSHPTAQGRYITTKYEPAYKFDANTDIDVPLSKNGLGPDYVGTSYLHPENVGKTIRIEMKGTRGKDFTEAFRRSGISRADAGDYVWHHLDDFEIIDGKPYCTMQLVLKEAHGGSGVEGMAHSGSVAQWKAYFGISDYP